MVNKPFIPRLANCLLWLCFYQISLLTLQGNSIKEIMDLSGDDRNFTQSASNKWARLSLTGMNNRPAGVWDSNDRYLSPLCCVIPDVDPFSLFVVLNTPTNFTDYAGIFTQMEGNIGDNADNFSLHFNSSNKIEVIVGSTSVLETVDTWNDGNDHIINLTRDASWNYKLYIDNVLKGSGTKNQSIRHCNATLGALNNVILKGFSGVISEVLEFHRELSEAERFNIVQYFKDWWGIA